MCKPAIVTLPCVLLLLDFWPLKRIHPGAGEMAAKLPRLLGEKVPFFALTVVSSIITLRAHQAMGVLASTEHTALAARVANSFVSYALYARNVVFPSRLAVVYPQEPNWAGGLVLAGAAVVLVPLIAGVAQWRTRPYLLVGWLWFLGTLVPTIGVVQAGHQAMADRATAAAYEKVLSQHPQESRALTGLSALLARDGRDAEALTLLEQAVAGDARSAAAQNHLGVVLERLGRAQEALARYQTPVQVKPELAEAWTGLGLLHAKSGRMGEALVAFKKAAGLRPNDAEALMRAGLAAANLQLAELAVRYLREAIRLRPDWPPPMNTLAWLLATHPDAAARNGGEAVKLARRACELLEFENPLYLDVLGAALAEFGNFGEARAMAKQALQRVQAANSPAPVTEFSACLELYRSGRAIYHQPRQTSAPVANRIPITATA